MELYQRARFKLRLVRLFYFSFPRPLIAAYLVVAFLAYIFVAVHTPRILYPTKPHDDGLYMAHGLFLSEGRWLGPFSEFTLMKGPGYPAFLAAANWLGVPVSLATALFHCATIFIFVWIAHQFIGSQLVSAGMFNLLLWHPATITSPLLRIIRDQIYYAQTLLFFALLLHALFLAQPGKQKVLAALLAGAALGWFWLTREEGIWILPGVAFVLAASARKAFAQGRLGMLIGTIATIAGVFVGSQMAFAAANWWYYGKFVGVDFKEANFQRALGAIHSVRSGGVKQFVSVTRAARERIYSVSPAFALLSPYLDLPADQGWGKISCDHQPTTCGEIGSAWFVWALRSAVTATGQYASPAKASAFFGLIADEIGAACADGRLECQPQRVPAMPPWTWAQLLDGLPGRYLSALDFLLLVHPSLQYSQSAGTEDDLDPALRLLRYPTYSPSPNAPPRPPLYTLLGWYYKTGDEWFSVTVTDPKGAFADVQMDRNPSPDVAKVIGNPDASRQRFVIGTRCPANCVLQVETREGEKLQLSLAELDRGQIGFDLGKAHLQIDRATVLRDERQELTRVETFAAKVRTTAVQIYGYGFIPTLAISVITFVVTTFFYWRKAIRSVSYFLAVAFWLLAFSRASLLILIAATSFPALNLVYFAPTYFMVIAASGFSFAAWLQAFAGRSNLRDVPNDSFACTPREQQIRLEPAAGSNG